jgi:hypothetical protein
MLLVAVMVVAFRTRQVAYRYNLVLHVVEGQRCSGVVWQ